MRVTFNSYSNEYNVIFCDLRLVLNPLDFPYHIRIDDDFCIVTRKTPLLLPATQKISSSCRMGTILNDINNEYNIIFCDCRLVESLGFSASHENR